MELYVLDKNLNRIGVIDEFSSLIWNRKYNTSGNFELYLPSTEDNIKILKLDNIIYKKGDDEAGYIQHRELALDENGKETLCVIGNFITGYIDKRIIWNSINFSGLTEVAMRKIVNDNCINPSDTNRKIPLLSLGTLKNYSEISNFQSTGDNCLYKLEELSNTSGLGYKVVIDLENKKLKFQVYKGVDRSTEQFDVAPVIFSKDRENILSEEYTEDYSEYRNTALVIGSSKQATINNTNTGLDRYELFIDAHDIQDKKYEGETEVTISDTDYTNLLVQKGNEKLFECKEIKTFESTVNTNGNNVYKVDYDLGDIITYQDKRWGVQVSTRITEIQEIYEGGKIQIVPTFGNSIPTIIDKIRKMVK